MTDVIDAKVAAIAARFPRGTAVKYYPVAGESTFVQETIRSEPWRLGHGDIVIKITGRAGGVLVDHLVRIA